MPIWIAATAAAEALYTAWAAMADAAFDISDMDNTPLAAIRTTGSTPTALYLVDLISGRAQRIGRIDDGSPIVGLAIEP